jgi:hypothetical protein
VGAHLAGADHAFAQKGIEGTVEAAGGLHLALIGARLQG